MSHPISNPIELYRKIRRLHRYLPRELRIIGNQYIRDEFKRHKNAEIYYVGVFMKEWNQYHNQLGQQLIEQGDWKSAGMRLDSRILDEFSEAQLGQLYELREAAKKIK